MSNAIMEALREGLEELFRLVIFGSLITIVGVVVTGINIQTGEIAINWPLVEAVSLFEVLTAFVKALDKAKHIYGKVKNPRKSGISYGLVKF